ncbi:cupin domain-containing protein [Sphingosinicella terrae]|jgi:quercetin dioxygenase-like cupin family protein|uniref:cupin domain-containing protein n=1 Tax=Sphingosinicella terrae TaxID=2172047 RepID=UPI000E0D02C5|nr:cupin domain-containing protein [Sphingosinicella terrae]
MKTTNPLRLALFVGAAAIASLGHAQATAPATAALPAGISRTDLARHDLAAAGHELIQVRVDFAPGAYAPGHTHPGEEVAYVLEGVLEYRLEGRPPVTLRAGETLFIPAGAVHSARNLGGDRASELATYIVRKGEPLLTPAE